MCIRDRHGDIILQKTINTQSQVERHHLCVQPSQRDMSLQHQDIIIIDPKVEHMNESKAEHSPSTLDPSLVPDPSMVDPQLAADISAALAAGGELFNPLQLMGFDPLTAEGNGMYPQYNKSTNYYQEFWRMYLHNELLIQKMKEFSQDTKLIQEKISRYEDIISAMENSMQDGLSPFNKKLKKKNRRTASQIKKDHVCPYEGCNKQYGSDVSLNLHIKLKHNGGNKTEREKIARTLYLAKLKGDKVPDVNINLPPGYIEVAKAECSLKCRDITWKASRTLTS
eukprot:TRINITY_DN1756_c0_g1_i9.p1 TRINITY_DN1756_c0_g1~~TRINITY_DN1756_c0_g1_i9.p1  ORF type:complete len:282 (+),score=38.69 TRINITY_DN1756_c0_g1_i9:66-911(+)